MAQRLDLSSNQILSLYTAYNNFWLTKKELRKLPPGALALVEYLTQKTLSLLWKIAEAHAVELSEAEPFLVTLAKRGVILPSEAILFDIMVEAAADKEEALDAEETEAEADPGIVNGTDVSNDAENPPSARE